MYPGGDGRAFLGAPNSKRTMLDVGIYRTRGPYRLPTSPDEGGVTGEDEAQAGGYQMVELINTVIQARKVPNPKDFNFVADLHRGFVLWARGEPIKRKYVDPTKETKTYVEFWQQSDVFALHQVNIILLRRARSDTEHREPGDMLRHIFDEFKMIGVCVTDVLESGENNARFQSLTVTLHGEADIRNHFSTRCSSGMRLCYSLRFVPVDDQVQFVPYSRTGTPTVSWRMYHSATQRRVRYVPRIVPFVPRAAPAANALMSKIRDNYGGEQVVKGFVYTLGFVQDDPLEMPPAPQGTMIDSRFFDNFDEMDLSDGIINADTAIMAPTLCVMVNKI